MPSSVITGRGPAAWSGDLAPPSSPGQLALLGPRDRDEAAGYGCVAAGRGRAGSGADPGRAA